MKGIAINPILIRVGITTPASHGSKYTNISCSPRKYQGALEGFIVRVGLAGSSRGAFKVIEVSVQIYRAMCI